MTTLSLQAGSAIESIPLPPISREQLREYAEASGDPNPIHLDDAAAKSAGLPSIIAHGMLVAGLLCQRAYQFMSDQPGWHLTRCQFRFKAMTLLGDTLSLGGVVKDATDLNVILDLQARNQRDEVTATASVRFTRE